MRRMAQWCGVHLSAYSYSWIFMIEIIYLGTFFNVQTVFGLTTVHCEKRDNCSCHMADGSGIIDLTNMRRNDGIPFFTNVTGKDNNLYSYNPCNGFSEKYSKGVCDDVALCELESKSLTYKNLGKQSTAVFKTQYFPSNSTYGISISYYNDKIITEVTLECADVNELIPLGALNGTTYKLRLKSPCACLDGCVNRLSVGSILLITTTFLFCTYLLVGCLYNKAVYNSDGRDLIPNYSFWADIPGLVKDGYLFFISPCLGDRAQYRYYERL